MKKTPRQTALFDDLPLPADLVERPSIPGSAKRLDPEQRRFNKLTQEVQALRGQLAAVQAQHERIRQRLMQDFFPLNDRLLSARVDLVKRLDALLNVPKGRLRLSRKRREGLESCLMWLLAPLMHEVDDPELSAIHDRHSPFTAEESAELDRALVEEMFGADALEGFNGGSLDDMIAHAQSRRAERQTSSGKRVSQRAAQLAQTQEEAQRAVREVYRNLASKLHPDRETDAARRSRKTELMQRINAAYEKGDLLTLLSLQLECEQLDADRLAKLPLERIRRYNHALQEQVRTLKAEMTALKEIMAELLEVSPTDLDHATDGDLMAMLDDRLDALRTSAMQIEAWCQGLADPGQRDGVIDALLDEMHAIEDDLGFAELEAIFMDDIEPSSKPRVKTRRNKTQPR